MAFGATKQHSTVDDSLEKERLTQLSKEIEILIKQRDDLADLSDSIKEEEAKFKKLSERNQELDLEVAKKEAQVNEATYTLLEMGLKIDTSAKQIKEKEQQLEDMATNIKSQQTIFDQLMDDCASKEGQISSLETALKSLGEGADNLQNEQAEKRQELQQIKESIDAMEVMYEEARAIQGIVDGLKLTKGTLDDAIRLLENKNVLLRDQHEKELATHAEMLALSTSKQEEIIHKQQEEIEKKEQELATREKILGDKIKKIKKYIKSAEVHFNKPFLQDIII